MKYFPFEKIVFQTTLSRREIIGRLSETTEPKRFFRRMLYGANSVKKFEGEVSESGFKIQRIIGYRNSFLPQIEGELEELGRETRIRIKMRLSYFVMAFAIFWCSVVFAVGFITLNLWLKSGQFNLGLPVVLFMLLFFYLMSMFGFKKESRVAKTELQQLFDAEIIQEQSS